MSTRSSTGECSTSSAAPSRLTAVSSRWAEMSRRKSRRRRKGRPARVTSASPSRSMRRCSSAEMSPAAWAGSEGAAIVATANTSGIWEAAASTAAPPRLWPTRSDGASWRSRSMAAAATRSATLEVNVVLANSPSLEPSPVKSNRSTAKPAPTSPALILDAAAMSLPQVKQWAKRAKARGRRSGKSRRPASWSPPEPVKETLWSGRFTSARGSRSRADARHPTPSAGCRAPGCRRRP
jgi:hypothetical protein